MAKLILSMDGLVLKEITLERERITIGRKPHNDIQIDNLAISGEHAAVVTILNDSFLEDLNSTNGTLVNGQPIKKHFLRHNDVVELGKYKLKYLNEGAPARDNGDFEKTMVLRPGTAAGSGGTAAGTAAAAVLQQNALAQSQPLAQAPAPTQSQPLSGAGLGTVSQVGLESLAGLHAAAAGEPRLVNATIQILNGANAGKELPLIKTLTSLGKPGVQVAVIARRPHGYFITHVEGASYPVLNGRPLDAQAHLLSDHDVIEISGVKMEFFYKS